MSEMYMDKVKDMLCKEMEVISRRGNISKGDLEMIEQLTASIKNIHAIEGMEEGGYSYDGDGMSSARYRRSYDGRSYNGDMDRSYDGRSYARRGQHYVRGHYSYAGSDMLRDHIEELMDDDRLSLDDKSILKKAMNILEK